MSRTARVVVALALVAAAVGPATATIAGDPVTAPSAGGPATAGSPADGPPSDAPRIVAVYPNPVADGDRGEFAVLQVPNRTELDRYTLSDGEATVRLPNRTVSGRVIATPDPAAARNLTGDAGAGVTGDTPAGDGPTVVSIEGDLALANSGERLRLRRGNETVARAVYREAPAGKLGRYDDRRRLTWRPLGRTDRPIVSADGGHVRAFTLPDSPGVPLSVIRSADRRVLLAGYTFTSGRVARALVNASARGVSVRVLLEGKPVDGISRRQARLLDRLVARGVNVSLVGGPNARYAYHHAKYAVVDDRAVVLTENWKPAGTGGRSSRGWGVVVSRRPVVRGLAETFRADAGFRDARPWRRFRRGRTFTSGGVANGSYPSNIAPATVPVNSTRLLVTPDSAGRAVVAALDNATESIDVIQLSIDGPDQRFLRATVRAARRGVEVRVLLSSAWYVREENRRLVERLRERASAEDLPLAAKLADPRGRYEKIHAKGVVIDGDEVLLGSLNWNGESIEQNREVVLALEGAAVGSYYERAFEADWAGGDGRSLPVGLVGMALGALILAALVARRIEFGENVGVGP